MAGTLFENNLSPYLTVVEQGSTPATPSAGNQKLFVRTSDHVLCYVNSSGTVTPVSGGTFTAPVASQVTRTAGDITTTSTSFVDMTGMSITLTTGARRVLMGFVGTGYHSATGPLLVDFNVDGSRVGGTNGLVLSYTAVSGADAHAIGITWLTAALSAGSHTFKVQWMVASGTGTFYANSSTNPIVFWAVEQMV